MAAEFETLYSCRLTKHGSLELAKWEDGRRYPTELYRIYYQGEGPCDCMGYSRHQHCKHKAMLQEWRSAGPLYGSFYDYDRKVLYVPDDNEGFPMGPYPFNIQGAINELAEAGYPT